MKHLSILLTIAVILSIAASPVKAQKALYGPSLFIHFPVGDMSDFHSTGIGFGAILKFGGKQVKFILRGTLSYLGGTTYTVSYPPYFTYQVETPAMYTLGFGAGVEYAFTDKGEVIPYGAFEFPQINFMGSKGQDMEIRIGLAFGGGVTFALDKNMSIDVGLRYQLLNMLMTESNENSWSNINLGISLLMR